MRTRRVGPAASQDEGERDRTAGLRMHQSAWSSPLHVLAWCAYLLVGSATVLVAALTGHGFLAGLAAVATLASTAYMARAGLEVQLSPSGFLHVRFGWVGSATIDLNDVVALAVVDAPSAGTWRDLHVIGLPVRPRDMVLRGPQAVQIALRSGATYLVGAVDPPRLAAALHSSIHPPT